MTDPNWRMLLTRKYPAVDQADYEPECDHDEVRCTKCGGDPDCSGPHHTECPSGCKDCEATHPCADCGLEVHCNHGYECQSCEDLVSR